MKDKDFYHRENVNGVKYEDYAPLNQVLERLGANFRVGPPQDEDLMVRAIMNNERLAGIYLPGKGQDSAGKYARLDKAMAFEREVQTLRAEEPDFLEPLKQAMHRRNGCWTLDEYIEKLNRGEIKLSRPSAP